MDAEEVADVLYALRPDEFTAERAAYAARARKEGDREAALRIAALRKPVLAAWSANLLARHDREVPAAGEGSARGPAQPGRSGTPGTGARPPPGRRGPRPPGRRPRPQGRAADRRETALESARTERTRAKAAETAADTRVRDLEEQLRLARDEHHEARAAAQRAVAVEREAREQAHRARRAARAADRGSHPAGGTAG
ncbi:hypothetical protein ACWF94_07265 [Streptomyces sp. NPDC055078]